MRIPDELDLISLKSIASQIGHFKLFGVRPLKIVGHMHLRTVCLSALTLGYTLSLCQHVIELGRKINKEQASAARESTRDAVEGGKKQAEGEEAVIRPTARKDEELSKGRPISPENPKAKVISYKQYGLEIAYDVSSIATNLTLLGFIFPAHYALAGGCLTVLTATLGLIKSYKP